MWLCDSLFYLYNDNINVSTIVVKGAIAAEWKLSFIVNFCKGKGDDL